MNIFLLDYINVTLGYTKSFNNRFGIFVWSIMLVFDATNVFVILFEADDEVA